MDRHYCDLKSGITPLERWPIVLMFSFALFKLWLVGEQDFLANHSPHDDYLFVEMAQNILNGEWLGGYHNRTLIKGIGYPLFIASAYTLSIPLLTAQHLFYLLACLTLALALRPQVKSNLAILLLFLLLVLNPYSYTYPSTSAVMRAGIYSSLTIFCFAGMYGLWERTRNSSFSGFKWSVILAFSLSYFWITREEGIWLVPGLILFGTLYVMPWNWNYGSSIMTRLMLFVFPIMFLVLVQFTIAQVNLYYYKVDIVNEIKTPEFISAYGGLMNIKEDEPTLYKIVGSRSEHKAFEISPAFRELEEYILDDGRSNVLYIWKLRSAANKAGYYDQPDDARRTLDLYARIGEELKTACENGKLKCYDRKPSLRPPLHEKHKEIIATTFNRIILDAIRFRKQNVEMKKYTNKARSDILLMFDYVTGENPFRRKKSHIARVPDFHNKMQTKKEYLMGRITKIYRYLIPVLLIVAISIHLKQIVMGLIQKRMQFKPMFGLVLFGSTFSILLVLVFVKVTLWPVNRPMHTLCLMVLIYIGFMLLPLRRQNFSTKVMAREVN